MRYFLMLLLTISLFFVGQLATAVAGNAQSPEQANAGGGAKVNNPSFWGSCSTDTVPFDCCTLQADTRLGMLYDCPTVGLVLVCYPND